VADGEDWSHVSSIDVHRQHYNVTFTLLALAAVAFSLLQSTRRREPGHGRNRHRDDRGGRASH
jgi:hypothetical protein